LCAADIRAGRETSKTRPPHEPLSEIDIMSTNIPRGRIPSLEWLEANIAGWSTNQAAIGLTSAQVTDLAVDIANTRSSFSKVEMLRADAKAETPLFYDKSDALSKKAGALVTVIKGFAEASDDPAAVYAAANLTPRNPPSPLPVPQQPTNGTAVLGGTGAVIVNFDARGEGGGTVWQVWRQLDSETAYSFLGNADAKTKSYADNTVPAGTSSAQYTIQGVRGSVKGPVSFAITVQFGGVTGAQDAAAA
jgi:hypothetical protein